MKYRKFQATQLFTGKTLLPGNQVLLTSEEGIVQAIVPASEAGDDIEQFRGILCPGFINCHCHLELSHLKGQIPERTGLVDFVYAIVTRRNESESTMLAAIELAEKEMLLHGIVAVGDICNNAISIPQKQQRNLLYHNFIELSGWNPAVAELRLESGLDTYRRFLNAIPEMPLSMAAHAPYSVSTELWAMIRDYFRGKTTSIHNQETAFEDCLFEKGTGDFLRMYELMNIDNNRFKPTGKSSLQSYIGNLNEAGKVLLVHNTFITEKDLIFCENLQNAGRLYFCLCPNANIYIENTLPPVELMRKHSIPLVLGTDSLASNHTLNILEEIKTILLHFPEIAVSEILQWASYNGAKALGIDHRYGSFETGRQPGIILIEQTGAHSLDASSRVRRLL